MSAVSDPQEDHEVMAARESEPVLDATTVDVASEEYARSAVDALVPALTILFHPDAERIGDIAVLDSRAELSRREPEFTGATGQRAPLADPALSRRPAILQRSATGDFVVRPGGSALDVDGRRVHEVCEVAAAELARGVILALGGRVVLLWQLVRGSRDPGPDLGLVGGSDAIAEVRRTIRRVALLPANVLIRGESGSGKELIARALHGQSPRHDGPLVCVNMGAVAPSTAVSELFGHVKGAFTGANTDHEGYFSQAHGGTLFLDEIGETPSDVQAMLLRTLETGEIRPLGSREPERVDVRVIAATDMDLDRAVDEGRLRLALRHRLANFEILVPPLRDRRADIARLFIHFLRQELLCTGEAERLARPKPDRTTWLPPHVMVELVRYHWPGNVRQLRNVARQIVLDNHGVAGFRLPATVSTMLRGTNAPARASMEPATSASTRDLAPAGEGQRGVTLDIAEERLIAALRENQWRPGQAARALGIARASMYKLMNQSPRIRKAKDLSRDEILASMEACAGDLDAMVQVLEVSRRGLQLRMTELGLVAW